MDDVAKEIALHEDRRAALKAEAKARIAEIDQTTKGLAAERASLVLFLQAPDAPKPRKRRRDAGTKRVPAPAAEAEA